MPASTHTCSPMPGPARHLKTVSVGVARAAQRQAVRQGMDLDAFCRRTGVTAAELQVPRGRVDPARHRRVAEVFRACLQDAPLHESLLTMDTLLEDHPLLAGLWCNCPSLGGALQAYVDYRDVLGELDGVACRSEGDAFELDYLPDDASGPLGASNALGNFLLLAAIVRHYAAEADADARPGGRVQIDLHLAGGPPLPDNGWRDVHPLRHHTRDGANHRFSLRGAGLWRPVGFFNAVLHRHFRAELNRELQGLHGAGTFAAAVRQQIERLLADGAEALPQASLQAVAERMNLSRWTVRRHLQDEGTSFQGVIDALRAEQAVTLLRERRLSMLDISCRLGFASQGSFTRFFKARFGRPPGRLVRSG